MKFAQCTECGGSCDPVFDMVTVSTAFGEVEIPMCCDCYEEVYGEAGSED
ncbi:hypothetical protein HWC69_gp059 [Gordonia phage Ranch]|uniref:Uncharacterized protein n=1 Tax=Gordonia phage Ranch TaxID=2599848 RepID=A0A5J6TNL5_9CAUD|nr:hypothetical protein HWC69_gp059 [Gordonia phage Ranch]QFG12410.1 hypothetical protein PBI_RANCH_59 [Gordonia phage Ranch]